MRVNLSYLYTHNECTWSKNGSALQLDGPCDFYELSNNPLQYSNFTTACDLTPYAMPYSGPLASLPMPWAGGAGPEVLAPTGQAVNTSFIGCMGAEFNRSVAAQQAADVQARLGSEQTMRNIGNGAFFGMLPLFLIGAAYMGWTLRRPSNVEWRHYNYENAGAYQIVPPVFGGAGLGLAAGASILHKHDFSAYPYALPVGAVCGVTFGVFLVGLKQGDRPKDNNMGLQDLDAVA